MAGTANPPPTSPPRGGPVPRSILGRVGGYGLGVLGIIFLVADAVRMVRQSEVRIPDQDPNNVPVGTTITTNYGSGVPGIVMERGDGVRYIHWADDPI